ncbi:MAG: hypothetical protein LBM92_02040, partial [Opitutaceae bacterium]|nr:hypothetical protein [Opitutaceae bacterium]
MPTGTAIPTDATLPATLAARLTDEQIQAVLEAPRGHRVKTLAIALNLSEPDALAKLVTASGLPAAVNLEADTDSLGLLPARLVHDYQIVPIAIADDDEVTTPKPQAPRKEPAPPAPNNTSILPAGSRSTGILPVGSGSTGILPVSGSRGTGILPVGSGGTGVSPVGSSGTGDSPVHSERGTSSTSPGTGGPPPGRPDAGGAWHP